VVGWLQASAAADPAPTLLQAEDRPSLNWYLGRELATGRLARRQLRDGGAERWVLSARDPSNAAVSCRLEHSAPDQAPEGPSLFHCSDGR
jgi:hypothetical protein